MCETQQPETILDPTSMQSALEIALNSLCTSRGEEGQGASSDHFSDIWVRDASCSIRGYCAVNRPDLARQTLEYILRFQQPETGQLPVRIGFPNKLAEFFMLFFGLTFAYDKSKKLYNENNWRTDMRSGPNVAPEYKVARGFGFEEQPPSDSSCVFITACANYVRSSNDVNFIRENIRKLENALAFNDNFRAWKKSNKFESDSELLWSPPYSTWADSLAKDGVDLYTNVANYQALLDMSYLLERIGEADLAQEYNNRANSLKLEIQTQFWSEEKGYFIDWFNDEAIYDDLTVDGNTMVILSGIASDEQTKSILSKVEEFKLLQGVPTRTNTPALPKELAFRPLRAINMGDYHNDSMSWTWLGCNLSMAYAKAGNYDQAEKIFSQILSLVDRDQTVFEVYERDGTPVDRTLYKSAKDFSWGAGTILHAFKYIFIQRDYQAYPSKNGYTLESSLAIQSDLYKLVSGEN